MDWPRALYNKDVGAVRNLIAAGEGIDRDAVSGHTPLLYAALMGSPEIVMLLIQAGADPCKLTPGGKSAIALAQEASVSKEVKERLVRMLRAAGASD